MHHAFLCRYRALPSTHNCLRRLCQCCMQYTPPSHYQTTAWHSSHSTTPHTPPHPTSPHSPLLPHHIPPLSSYALPSNHFHKPPRTTLLYNVLILLHIYLIIYIHELTHIYRVIGKKRYKISHLPENDKLNTFASMKLCGKKCWFLRY